MDQDTQKNAAMVEEHTAASHGLARDAASLNALLGQFKLSVQIYNSAARAAEMDETPAAPLTISPFRIRILSGIRPGIGEASCRRIGFRHLNLPEIVLATAAIAHCRSAATSGIACPAACSARNTTPRVARKKTRDCTAQLHILLDVVGVY